MDNKNDRFDFEQQVMNCWRVTDDLKDLAESVENNDIKTDMIVNALNGMNAMYEIKFNKLWDMFESVFMKLVRDEKMARDDADALREQLIAETQGYGAGKSFQSGAGASVDFGQFGKLDTKYGALETQGTAGVATMKANKKGKK